MMPKNTLDTDLMYFVSILMGQENFVFKLGATLFGIPPLLPGIVL